MTPKNALRFTLLLAIASAISIGLARGRGDARASGTFPQDVYLWQRTWTPPVVAAVDRSRGAFAHIVVLSGEITWHDGSGRVDRAQIDYDALKRSSAGVGLALRIGPHHGLFARDDAAARFLLAQAAAIVGEAKSHGAAVDELQIDFDCPTSRLAGYRTWLSMLKEHLAPLPITITALPAWLQSSDFAALSREAGSYVLQVHSLDKPASPDAPMRLCDPAAARRAVEAAGRIGIPFRVALPTYAYCVAFAESGQMLGLSAEGPQIDWPAGAIQRELRANPGELSALVNGWTTDRPAAMRGVIWYRLPVDTDRLNWRWPTLVAVMRGKTPSPDLRINSHLTEEGATEVELTNSGDGDAALNGNVVLDWEGNAAALDSVGGFRIVQRDEHELILRADAQPLQDARLVPGESRPIAWIRIEPDKEVRGHVEPSP